MKRKQINTYIRKDINEYFTDEKRALLNKKIRKAIFSVIGPFEELEEPKIQDWAHKMVPQTSHLAHHADRIDIKISMRKYMRLQTLWLLGLQGFFPEIFEPVLTSISEEKKDEAK